MWNKGRTKHSKSNDIFLTEIYIISFSLVLTIKKKVLHRGNNSSRGKA
jgi:hypothetical protein